MIGRDGDGMSLAEIRLSALNPSVLWARPPRRPSGTPWAVTLLLLAGLACWLIGERCARGEEPRAHRTLQAPPAVGGDPRSPLTEAAERVLVTWTGALALTSLAGLGWVLWRRL